MGSRDALIAEAARWVTGGGFEADLAPLVAIPSESQRPDCAPDLLRYLRDGILPWCARLRAKAVIHEDGTGFPILTAVRHENDNLPTILIYGHGDVVHGQSGQWSGGRDPFTLSRDDDRLFGRGTADNKSQHLINLAALDIVLKERGHLGFNLKLLIETGEETGSPGLEDFVQANGERLSADVLIASDGPRLEPGTPTAFTGSRGAVNFRLIADLRDGAHHSGNWGGLLCDPAILIAQALAAITDARGAILIPEWRPDSLTPDIRAALARLPEPSAGPALSADWGEPGLSPAERVFGWNSFAVLALAAGQPDAPQNAINGYAAADCQLRFVVGTDAADIIPALRRHLDRAGLAAVAIEFDGTIAPATRLSLNDPWLKLVATSLQTTAGKAPHLLPNLGGFIPNHVFCDLLGMPTIWVPHSYGGCSQHAPNEHVLLSVATDAARCMAGLFWDIGEGGGPPRGGA